jgi:hypothetical protein
MKHVFTKDRGFRYALWGGAVLVVLVVFGSVGDGGSSSRPNYENQDRNAPCFKDGDCLSGLSCEGATKDEPGRCTFVCKADKDCGNGYLCRAGSCQKDCSGPGEKCSDRRVCCFFDADGDKASDAVCAPDETGEIRCLVQ